MFSIDAAPMSWEPITIVPAGVYRATISNLDLKPNKNSEGDQYVVTYTLVSPNEIQGMKVTQRYTFTNRDSTSMEIGRAQLADMMFTIRVPAFGNSDEFRRLAVGKELIIETELEEDDKGQLWPRVVCHWSLGGKHRNERRCRNDLVLGPSGKPPRARKSKGNSASYNGGGSHRHDDNVPF